MEQLALENLSIYEALYGVKIKQEDKDALENIKKLYRTKDYNGITYIRKNGQYTFRLVLGAQTDKPDLNFTVHGDAEKLIENNISEFFSFSGRLNFSSIPDDMETVENLLKISKWRNLNESYSNSQQVISPTKGSVINTIFGNSNGKKLIRSTILRNPYVLTDSEYYRSMLWLFDIKDDLPKNFFKDIFENMDTHKVSEFPWAMYYAKVYDIPNNKRLLFGITKANSWRYTETKIYVYEVKSESPVFDFIDENTWSTDFSETHPGFIQFTEDVKNLPADYSLIADYARSERKKDEIVIINEKIINNLIVNEKRKEAKEKEDIARKNTISKKFAGRLSKINEKPIVINDVIYTKHSATYSGQSIASKSVDFTDFLRRFQRNSSLETIIFDIAFEYFCKEVALDASIKNSVSAKIGDVVIKTEKKETVIDGVTYSRRVYINGHRINLDEVKEVFTHALCFSEQTVYDKFLSQVSECSLRIHHYLNNGLIMKIRNPLLQQSVIIKLLIVRKDNKNHLMINKNLYKIKNINKVLSLENKTRLSDLIQVLSDSKTVENLNKSELSSLMIEGRERYEDAMSKSKQLLDDTIVKLSLQATSFNGMEGFIVPGKLDTYFVHNDISLESGRGRCGVYRYPGGNYVCIVDKSTKQVGLDKLVNRVYALKNDSRLVSSIHTLNVR